MPQGFLFSKRIANILYYHARRLTRSKNSRLLFIAISSIFLLLLFLLTLLFHTTSSPSSSTSPLKASHEVLPAIPRIVLHDETKFNGLGAQLLRILDGIALAHSLNAQFIFRPVVVHPNGTRTFHYWNYGSVRGKSWSSFFEERRVVGVVDGGRIWKELEEIEGECEEVAEVTEEEWKKRRCLRIGTEASERMAFRVMYSGKIEKEGFESDWWGNLVGLRRMMRDVFVLNRDTEEAVAGVLEKGVGIGIGSENGMRYVGVHLRRGDKMKEVRAIPLEYYAQAVRLMDPGSNRVYVASDDCKAVHKLERLVVGKQVHSLCDQDNGGHNQRDWNTLSFKKRRKATIMLLADMIALAKADIFIGTFSSNLGKVVHLLRSQKAETTISLDDGWEPGVAWRNFGTRYCDSVGANQQYCRRFYSYLRKNTEV